MTAEPWPLPASWHWSAFADVARVASDLVDPKDYPSEPHIAPNHIERETGRLLPFATIAEDGVMSANHRFRAGQILYSKIRPYLAKVVVVEFDGLCSADMYPIETELDPRFLKWWMLTREFTRQAAGQQARTILPKINKQALGLLPVPVAPWDEQRRIVDILEGHLSRLDAAVSGSAAARTRMAQWQRSIMLRAILGWSGDRAESIRTGVDLAGPLAPDISLPLGWCWSKWQDIGSSQNGKLFPSSDYSQEGVRLLRPGNMGADGSLTWTLSATRRLPISYAQRHTAMLVTANDLVMNLTAQSLKDDFLGRVCIVGPEDSSLLNQRIARLRTSTLTPGFALIVFRSALFREYVKALNTGSLIQHMFTKQINAFWLPVPPKDVQVAIAADVRDKLAVSMRMTEAVDVVNARSLALRRSLLSAAFSGRLTGRASDLDLVEELTVGAV